MTMGTVTETSRFARWFRVPLHVLLLVLLTASTPSTARDCADVCRRKTSPMAALKCVANCSQHVQGADRRGRHPYTFNDSFLEGNFSTEILEDFDTLPRVVTPNGTLRRPALTECRQCLVLPGSYCPSWSLEYQEKVRAPSPIQSRKLRVSLVNVTGDLQATFSMWIFSEETKSIPDVLAYGIQIFNDRMSSFPYCILVVPWWPQQPTETSNAISIFVSNEDLLDYDAASQMSSIRKFDCGTNYTVRVVSYPTQSYDDDRAATSFMSIPCDKGKPSILSTGLQKNKTNIPITVKTTNISAQKFDPGERVPTQIIVAASISGGLLVVVLVSVGIALIRRKICPRKKEGGGYLPIDDEEAKPTKAFVVYSKLNEKTCKAARKLTTDLRQFWSIEADSEDHSHISNIYKHADTKFKEVDYIIFVCCKDLFSEWESQVPPSGVLAVAFTVLKSQVVNPVANENNKLLDKCVGVVLKEEDRKYVPTPLTIGQVFVWNDKRAVQEQLALHLSGQPQFSLNPLKECLTEKRNSVDLAAI